MYFILEGVERRKYGCKISSNKITTTFFLNMYFVVYYCVLGFLAFFFLVLIKNFWGSYLNFANFDFIFFWVKLYYVIVFSLFFNFSFLFLCLIIFGVFFCCRALILIVIVDYNDFQPTFYKKMPNSLLSDIHFFLQKIKIILISA